MTINKVYPQAISMKDIRDEWSDTGSTSLNEFYGEDINLPKSGTISLKDFYGATNIFYVSDTSLGVNNRAIRRVYDPLGGAAQLGWNRYSKLNLTLGSDFGAFSNSSGVAAVYIQGPCVKRVQIQHFGVIMGRGGAGSGGATNGSRGGDAIWVSVSGGPVYFYNYGYVLAGGGGGGGNAGNGGYYGGGGGGAGGGTGGTHTGYGGGGGGGIGASGGSGSGDGSVGGGGQAGGGGGGWEARKGADARGSGGGGGRVWTTNATGGSGASGGGGRGGAHNSTGGNGSVSGGGGGYGKRGGSGGYSGGSGGVAVNVFGGSFSYLDYGVSRG